MRQGAHPLKMVLWGVAAAIAVVLAGYFGWMAVWMLTVEGDDSATTLERTLVVAGMVLIAACFVAAAFGLVRYLRGRAVRWWAVVGAYLVGLLGAPVALFAYLAYLSGG